MGDGDPILSAADARRLEIFLDRMAWTCAKGESSWVLDGRYEALLSDGDRLLVEALLALPPIEGNLWQRLRDLLEDYGADAAASSTPLRTADGDALGYSAE